MVVSSLLFHPLFVRVAAMEDVTPYTPEPENKVIMSVLFVSSALIVSSRACLSVCSLCFGAGIIFTASCYCTSIAVGLGN